MYKIIEWHESLDLDNFYQESARRGFVNNSNQKIMIDCFKNEKEWNAWILYENDQAIGSVVAHSFDDVMGVNTYRILTRTCVLNGTKTKGLITAKNAIMQHQNFTDQFLLPKCLQWTNNKGKVYATSNTSHEASQRLVHSIYFPTLAKLGIVREIKEIYYRNTKQTVWEIHPEKFYENFSKYPKWIKY